MSSATMKLSLAMQDIMKGLDVVLEEVCGEKQGFTLIVYTDLRANYASNVSREEAIREMKSLITYWEAGGTDIPTHTIN